MINNKLVQYINNADVFIIASIEDGYPIVIPQVLACAVPVISTFNTGSSELITKYNCGYVVPSMNSESILDKLYKLNDDKVLLRKFSENATKASGVTWENFVNNLNEKIKKYSNN